jgi:signal transduction histidine kinase
MKALEGIAVQGKNKNLRDVIDDWDNQAQNEDLNKSKCRFKCQDDEFVYALKTLTVNFQDKTCKTIILEDQTAYDQLAKLDERFQRLYVASIIHDVRTPLDGIIGMLDMLNLTQCSPEQEQYLSVARNSCTLILFLTHDIKDYSELDTGKFLLENARTNIRDILDETKQYFAFTFEKKRIDLFHEISPTVPRYVCIDKRRYMQILINLLSNSLKFTFYGHAKVLVDYDDHNNMLITTVRDTGVGIKEEDKPLLFRLFGKLQRRNPQVSEGVGFGLTICKRLTEALGGTISVSSIVNQGTTFTFSIKSNVNLLEAHHSLHPSECAMSNVSSSYSPGDLQPKFQSHCLMPFSPERRERRERSRGHRASVNVARHLQLGPRLDSEEVRLEVDANAEAEPEVTPEGEAHRNLVTLQAEEQKQVAQVQQSQSLARPLEVAGQCRCSQVLVVDDEMTIVFVLQKYLQSVRLQSDTVPWHSYLRLAMAPRPSKQSVTDQPARVARPTS